MFLFDGLDKIGISVLDRSGVYYQAFALLFHVICTEILLTRDKCSIQSATFGCYGATIWGVCKYANYSTKTLLI